jgi:hypothetical protein
MLAGTFKKPLQYLTALENPKEIITKSVSVAIFSFSKAPPPKKKTIEMTICFPYC